MKEDLGIKDSKAWGLDDGEEPAAYRLLKLPDDPREAIRVLSGLFRLQTNIQEFRDIRRWLEDNFVRLNAENAEMVDMTTIRWNQGAIQLLIDVFKITDNSRSMLETIQGGNDK